MFICCQRSMKVVWCHDSPSCRRILSRRVSFIPTKCRRRSWIHFRRHCHRSRCRRRTSERFRLTNRHLPKIKNKKKFFSNNWIVFKRRIRFLWLPFYYYAKNRIIFNARSEKWKNESFGFFFVFLSFLLVQLNQSHVQRFECHLDRIVIENSLVQSSMLFVDSLDPKNK